MTDLSINCVKKPFFILSVLVSAAFCLQSDAATFIYSPPTDDAYYDGNSLINSDPLLVARQSDNKNVYLRFDISNPALNKSTITSAKLRMYFVSNEQNPEILPDYVSNDNWTETSGPVPDFIDAALSIAGTVDAESWKTWNLNTALIPEFGNADNIISFALRNHDNGVNKLETYYSKDYLNGLYAPQLIIEASPAPVPEPSSLILGFMSLGGLVGFRRKRK